MSIEGINSAAEPNDAAVRATMTFAKPRNGSRKLILVALAAQSDSAGHANISIRDLMRMTGISERGVQVCLRDLEDAGWLMTSPVFTLAGASAPNHYRMPWLPAAILRMPVGWKVRHS